MNETWLDTRASGLLLHPTSLPGPDGVGDLGPAAHRFLEDLASAGQTAWQMLPVGPPGRSFSPYDATSAFAGSPWLLSLAPLVGAGLLGADEARPTLRFPAARVDYRLALAHKLPRLRAAFRRALEQPVWTRRMDGFLEREGDWLADAALFAALKDVYRGRSWTKWDPALRDRRAAALREARRAQARRFRFQVFLQLVFALQWEALRDRARELGIALIGDIPIYVSLESADVWSHPELFDLGRTRRPRTVAGVPPDYFNRNGQRWGNPTYLWERHRREGYRWWVRRLAHTLEQFDSVRLDHFIGFHRCWTIPGRARTARRGIWRPGPGYALFEALFAELGPVTLIAEDLGLVTPEVHALRERCGFPGMRILQFAFDGKPENGNVPHNLPRRCVAYTGTHDNKTLGEWFRQRKPDNERRKADAIARERRTALRYLASDGKEPHWDLIRAALASVAGNVVFPVQDVLGLGAAARMNRPGTARGNWTWRLREGELTADALRRLGDLSRTYGRVPAADPARASRG